MGKPFYLLLSEESAQEAIKTLESRKRGELGDLGLTTELTQRRKDGTEFVAEARSRPVLDSDGGMLEIVGVMRDITERKKAEEALRESQHLYRSAIEVAGAVPYYQDYSSKKYTFVGSGIEALTGYSDEEFTYEMWQSLEREEILLGDLAGLALEDAIKKAKGREGISWRADYRIATRSGEEKWVANSAVQVRDDQQEVIGSLGILQDITERKRAEETLALEARFQRVLGDIANEFITILPTTIDAGIDRALETIGVFVDADRSYIIRFDFQAGTIRNTHEWCREGIVPQIANLQDIPIEPFEWAINRLVALETVHVPHVKDLPPEASGAKEEFEAEGIQSLLLVPLVFEGTCVGTVGFDFVTKARSCSKNDIRLLYLAGATLSNALNRKRAEEALRVSEEHLRALFVSTGEAILVVDAQGKVAHCNQEFSNMWRVPPELLETKDDDALLEYALDQLDNPAAFLAKVRRLYASKEKERDTLRFKDGRYIERHSSPLIENDRVAGRVWCFRDITEQKHLEDQLRQSQKMEAVGQLAGGIAHDFNNILQAIIGYAAVAKSRLAPSDQAYRHMGQVLKGSERAAELTRRLLAFSRRQIITPINLDLGRVITGISKMLQRVIGEHIELNMKLGSDTRAVYADPGAMEQVLMNLCVNARDAMPKGGQLTIETENVVLSETFCQTHLWATPGDYTLLSVTDTGMGIPPEVVEHIFEPFFTTKETGKGTGLGLPMVYGIVKQHEGLIQCYSEPGKGTRFDTYLRSVEGGVEINGKGDETSEPPGGTETILVAEDNEMVRELTVLTLEEGGYKVFVAKDGEEALRLFEVHREDIQLALLDVVMPKIGGREVYDTIRAFKPNLPILFSSGYSIDALHTGFIVEKGLKTIPKPYTPDALLQKVREVLDAE